MTQEPEITINGRRLTPAQAMTVRVAVENFATYLRDGDALGTDEHGLAMAKAYRERIDEIRACIFQA